MKRRTHNTYTALIQEDLKKSGLTLAHVKKMGIKILDEIETELVTGYPSNKCKIISYEIPYFDQNGKLIKYSRLKIISIDPNPDKEPPYKYYQKENTIPRIYFPPFADWKKIVKDPSIPITITEGEKKAACATILKIPTVGLGGVWSFKAKNWGLDKIPDLDIFDWKNREVDVCYDSDLKTNKDVDRALHAFANLLTGEGARVFFRYLSNEGDGKTGLDDYLVAHGKNRYLELYRSEHDSSAELHAMNTRVAYVREGGNFIDLRDGELIDPRRLIDRFGIYAMHDDKGKTIPAINTWRTWPHRREVDKLVYIPGGERPLHDNAYNLWKTWGTTPKKGPITPILDLIDSMEQSDWFLQWLAYPIQNPGAKLRTAVILFSTEQGTGKSSIAEVMHRIYGEENTGLINSLALNEGRNSWAAQMQFAIGDEISDSKGKVDYDNLKTLITEPYMLVNPKNIRPYKLANVVNILITTNHPNALSLMSGDRRWAVMELAERWDKKKRDAFYTWLRNGGAAHFMYHLLNEVDCSKFDPFAEAPMTDAKYNMETFAKTDLQMWVESLLESPDAVIGAVDRERIYTAQLSEGQDVFTPTQLYDMIPQEIKRNISMRTLGLELGRAKAARPRSGVVKYVDQEGKRASVRLWAIRNLTDWRRAADQPTVWIDNWLNGRKKKHLEKSKKVVKLEDRRRK